MIPLRNVGETITCPVCQLVFQPAGRQRVCSAACRQVAWRRRHAAPAPAIPLTAPRVATIYECPNCATWYLGEQRCADCGVFCRKLGPGSSCPHCDEPILLADLILETPVGAGAPKEVRH